MTEDIREALCTRFQNLDLGQILPEVMEIVGGNEFEPDTPLILADRFGWDPGICAELFDALKEGRS